MESDLPKYKSALARKITISHPLPLLLKGSTTASNPAETNIMAVPNMQSPGKRCKASCPICAQSTTHPSPTDSDWSGEDWDDELIEENMGEKKEKRNQRVITHQN